jgi:hypothetical protein
MFSISSQATQVPITLPMTQPINLVSEFKSIFALSGKEAKTVSVHDQLQALVLLERMTSNTQKGPIESHQDRTPTLQKVPQIPCVNTPYNLTETLNDGLANHPKIKTRLCRSIEQWKSLPFSIEAPKRPGFIERDDDKKTISVTRNTVLQRQAPASLGKKYSNQETLFDPSLSDAIDSNYADIDHMDPWSKIVERIQTCTDFINTFPNHKVKVN